jgi:hypothetical protein
MLVGRKKESNWLDTLDYRYACYSGSAILVQNSTYPESNTGGFEEN